MVYVTEPGLYPRMWLDGENIFHVDYGTCTRITFEHAIQVAEYSKNIPAQTGRKIRVITHAQHITEIDPQAQALFFSKAFEEQTAACASLGHPSGFNAPVGGLYVFFETPPYPCEFFTEEAEALAWLRTI